jgi:MoxR-like ATPase
MNEKIPPELVDALSKDKGFSLLIKGAPGTGKTLLALEIVRMFGGVNTVYLKLTALDNSVLIYGIRPETGLYSQDSAIVDDHLKLELIPYV